MNETANTDETTPVSMRVVETMAETVGKSPTELEPLYYSVPPECVDRLFATNEESADSTMQQITFTYEGHVVTVSSDGSIDIAPMDVTTTESTLADSTGSHVRTDPESPN